MFKHCVLRCLRQAAVMIFPPLTLPALPRRAIDQTSTSSSTLAATLCAHVGKCKQPECVASRPLPGQCMLPALTADSAFRYATPAPTATLDSNYDSYSRVRQAQRSPMWFIGICSSLSASLQVTLPLPFSLTLTLSSLPLPLSSSMRLVSLAPFCYLNCRSISLSAFWRDAASPASHYQAGVFMHVCVRVCVSHSLSYSTSLFSCSWRFHVLSHRRFIYCSLPVVAVVVVVSAV